MHRLSETDEFVFPPVRSTQLKPNPSVISTKKTYYSAREQIVVDNTFFNDLITCKNDIQIIKMLDMLSKIGMFQNDNTYVDFNILERIFNTIFESNEFSDDVIKYALFNVWISIPSGNEYQFIVERLAQTIISNIFENKADKNEIIGAAISFFASKDLFSFKYKMIIFGFLQKHIEDEALQEHCCHYFQRVHHKTDTEFERIFVEYMGSAYDLELISPIRIVHTVITNWFLDETFNLIYRIYCKEAHKTKMEIASIIKAHNYPDNMIFSPKTKRAFISIYNDVLKSNDDELLGEFLAYCACSRNDIFDPNEVFYMLEQMNYDVFEVFVQNIPIHIDSAYSKVAIDDIMNLVNKSFHPNKDKLLESLSEYI